MKTTLAPLGFDELPAFVTVVCSGSFSRAADTLSTQEAHLSLEMARLLQRSTRSLMLTEAGREL